MIEVWKPVVGHEGAYEVSNRGNVRNAASHVLSPNAQNNGYVIVHLYSGGRHTRKPKTIHRLVAEAFLGAPNGREVNHLDGVKTNNTVANLEWTTRSLNNTHAFETGLTNPPRNAVVGVSVTDGHEVRFPCQRDAEKALTGKATSAVHNCLVGKSKTAFGYVWSRA